MMTDPISDMLTRVRNGLLAKKESVLIPFSKLKFKIALIFEQEKYVSSVKEKENFGKKDIEIKLSYKENGQASISSIKRISKPGKRVYVGKDELPNVLHGYGIAIISTPQGVMTNREAKKKGVGGEIICEIS